MLKDFSTLISSLVIIVSLIIPSAIDLQPASSIVTEEDLAERALAEYSAEEKAMEDVIWKNYTNSEFGYSIEYPEVFGPPKLLPSDWSEGDITMPIGAYMFLFYDYAKEENQFLPSFGATLYVYLADSYDKTLRQFMSEDNSAGALVKSMPQPTEISIAGNTTGLEYKAIDMLGTPVEFVGFVHDRYIYVLGSDDIDSKNSQILYDHMLNSFKFVNITERSDNDDSSDQSNLDDNDPDNENRDEEDSDNRDGDDN